MCEVCVCGSHTLAGLSAVGVRTSDGLLMVFVCRRRNTNTIRHLLTNKQNKTIWQTLYVVHLEIYNNVTLSVLSTVYSFCNRSVRLHPDMMLHV